MPFKIIGLGLLITLISLDLWAQKATVESVPAEISAVMEQPRYRHARWGLLVVDMDSGEIVHRLHNDEFFMPASTTKQFSVAAAFETLGATHRITTPVRYSGEIDSDGVLQGDLILVGAGDITLGGRRRQEDDKDKDIVTFTDVDHIYANIIDAAILTEGDPLAGLNELARQIAAAGVNRVAGEVIVDDRLFETIEPRPGLIASPLAINENLLDVIIKPGQQGQAAILDWRPRGAIIAVDNQVQTVGAGEQTRINIQEKPTADDRLYLVVQGQIAGDRDHAVRTHPFRQPARIGRSLFIEALERADIQVTAEKVADNPLADLPPVEQVNALSQIAALQSPPLAEFGKLILKVSHNQGAEMLPLLIAAKHGEYSYREGMRRIGEILPRLDIAPDTISFGDAAGGDSNRATPTGAVALLRHMSTRPDFAVYKNAQPILGMDGSIGRHQRNSPAAGKVFAKTGTGVIEDATHDGLFLTTQALAGYIDLPDRQLAFGLYVNNALLNETDDPIFGDLEQTAHDLARIAALLWQHNAS